MLYLNYSQERLFKNKLIMSDIKRILISGAAGQIGYAICSQIARGAIYGQQQRVILHLLDIEPAKNSLEGVKMELIDCAYPLLADVLTFTEPTHAFKDVDIAILCGGFPRKPGMERKDVMSKNASIYVSQGKALDKYAKKNVKVLVVANPANTNALILAKNAPSIPKSNITALTRLDHNRALGLIAQRAHVDVGVVKNVIIWGNHSSTQVPDVDFASVDFEEHQDISIYNVLQSQEDKSWLEHDFVSRVQQRGAEIMKMRGLSSAMSAASAACDHMRDWIQGTPEGEWVSMAVYSDGSYGQPKDVMYSFPCACDNGRWVIVQDLPLSKSTMAKMKITADELLEERALALTCM